MGLQLENFGQILKPMIVLERICTAWKLKETDFFFFNLNCQICKNNASKKSNLPIYEKKYKENEKYDRIWLKSCLYKLFSKL